jgi:hypothetical protein
MSRQQDDHAALANLRQAIEESASRRRGKPPTRPRVLLQDIMDSDHLNYWDVSNRTKLTSREVARLLSGELPFTETICEELSEWIGPRRAKVLRELQLACDHYDLLGERPKPPPVPDTPEARKTARWYAAKKRPG